MGYLSNHVHALDQMYLRNHINAASGVFSQVCCGASMQDLVLLVLELHIYVVLVSLHDKIWVLYFMSTATYFLYLHRVFTFDIAYTLEKRFPIQDRATHLSRWLPAPGEGQFQILLSTFPFLPATI